MVLSILLSLSSIVTAAFSPSNPRDKNTFYLCPNDNSEDECQCPTDEEPCCGKYTSEGLGNSENVCSKAAFNAQAKSADPTFSFKCNGGVLYEKILSIIFMGIMLYINIWKDTNTLF